jgi:transcriptional regulator with XRE-family HTH domain
MAESINVSIFGSRLKRIRKKRELTLEQVAESTGVSVPTLSRIERGASDDIGSGTLLALSAWMGTSVKRLTEKPAPRMKGGKIVEDTPEIVDLYLRADKNLNQGTATALSKMFRLAYETLAKQAKGE